MAENIQSFSVLLAWKPTSTELDLISEGWPSEVSVYVMADLDEADLDLILPQVQVMVGYMAGIPVHRLAEASNLRLIHVLGHGVDGVLSPEVTAQLQQRGVRLARANPASIPIAEFVMMSMIALSRRTIGLHNALTLSGDWSNRLIARSSLGTVGGELHGAKVGLIGYGNIAREIRPRAGAFGMQVGALTRQPEKLEGEGLSFVVPWGQLGAFLAACDYVVLTVPLTSDTDQMIGSEQVTAMKPGSYLINVGRGRLVDEEAVIDGLASGQLAGAALDVFESESLPSSRCGYPTRRPLHQFNTVLTPHYAGATAESAARSISVVGENLRSLIDGTALVNEVELDLVE